MKVVLLILQYGNSEYTAECLGSALPQRPAGAEIVVVDNASPTGFHELYSWLGEPPLEEVTTDYLRYGPKEHIHLLRTAQNLGYGQGNNVGAAYAFGQLRADYVWVLNNDTRLDKDAFSELYAYITRHPDAEIIGQTVLDYGTSSVQALGGAKYNPILGVGKRIGVGQSIDAPLPPPPAVEKQLDYLAGASFVISRALYEKVGLFAPEFFLYFEEIDLAKRVKGTGADLRWAPGVKIEHKEGASISPGRRSALSEYHATLSSLIATRKHYPFLLPLTLVVRALYKLPRYALSRRWDLLRAHFGGIGKFLERYLSTAHD